MVFPLIKKCDINSRGLKIGKIAPVWPLEKLAKLSRLSGTKFKLQILKCRAFAPDIYNFHFALFIFS
jgi:hypothetical protein